MIKPSERRRLTRREKVALGIVGIPVSLFVLLAVRSGLDPAPQTRPGPLSAAPAPVQVPATSTQPAAPVTAPPSSAEPTNAETDAAIAASQGPSLPEVPLPVAKFTSALDRRFAKEADIYVNGCGMMEDAQPDCKRQIEAFERNYVAARHGDHDAIKAVSAALSNDAGNTIFNSPLILNEYQGCAWAIVGSDASFAAASEDDQMAVNRRCAFATTPEWLRGPQTRATILLDQIRHPSRLPPPIPFPAPGSPQAKRADAAARAEAALYIKDCSGLSGEDQKACNFSAREFVLSYRRAMANDLSWGQENVAFDLFGDSPQMSTGVKMNRLQGCAWSIVAASPYSPQTQSTDVDTMIERCRSIGDAAEAKALTRARAILTRIANAPNAPPSDDEDP